MSALFSPIRFRDLALENRIMVSPMCQYSAEDGVANDWHSIHINTLSLSGAALICIEATHVEPVGRITPGCLGLYNDRCEEALAEIVKSVRRKSSGAVALQLAHAGRKASSARPWDGGRLLSEADGGWSTVGPSPIPHKEGEATPAELNQAGLARIRSAFVDAAKRSGRIGIDALELHAAHGYLLHQFLSPIANQRADEYGGSIENRMRFPLEVFDAVRSAFTRERPNGVRVSATDWIEGGWDIDQTIRFARELKERGADWIDVSSGGVSPQQKIVANPGYQVPFARRVKQEVGIPTIAVGLITEARQAQSIIVDGHADMVAIGRAMLYDPRWGWHAAADLGATVNAPRQYWRSQPAHLRELFGCTQFGSR